MTIVKKIPPDHMRRFLEIVADPEKLKAEYDGLTSRADEVSKLEGDMAERERKVASDEAALVKAREDFAAHVLQKTEELDERQRTFDDNRAVTEDKLNELERRIGEREAAVAVREQSVTLREADVARIKTEALSAVREMVTR